MSWSPENIVIHHTVTASTEAQARAVAAQQKYHLLIVQEPGRAPIYFQGVPDDRPSQAGTGCYNSRAYAIALVGNFQKQQPSQALLNALVQAIVIKARKLPGPQGLTYHQYVGQVLAACRYGTACPGDFIIAEMGWIKAEVAKRL